MQCSWSHGAIDDEPFLLGGGFSKNVDPSVRGHLVKVFDGSRFTVELADVFALSEDEAFGMIDPSELGDAAWSGGFEDERFFFEEVGHNDGGLIAGGCDQAILGGVHLCEAPKRDFDFFDCSGEERHLQGALTHSQEEKLASLEENLFRETTIIEETNLSDLAEVTVGSFFPIEFGDPEVSLVGIEDLIELFGEEAVAGELLFFWEGGEFLALEIVAAELSAIMAHDDRLFCFPIADAMNPRLIFEVGVREPLSAFGVEESVVDQNPAVRAGVLNLKFLCCFFANGTRRSLEGSAKEFPPNEENEGAGNDDLEQDEVATGTHHFLKKLVHEEAPSSAACSPSCSPSGVMRMSSIKSSSASVS